MKEEIVAYEENADFDGSDIVISRQELVRCKDCRHSTKFSVDLYSCMVRVVPDGIKYRKPDWFCADGERRL